MSQSLRQHNSLTIKLTKKLKTVDCGIPPEKPKGGSITWLNGTENQVLNTRKYIINFQNEIYLRVKTNIIRKNCTYNELMGLFVF